MKSITPETLIFDLDGTLIDSSASILAGFDAALAAHKIEPNRALTAEIIGPPLRETLSTISGKDDHCVLDALTRSFMDYYDTEGYKASIAFPGIDEMLRLAHSQGLALHLATNKRLIPTKLILERLGWNDVFSSVYALDMRSPPLPNKARMLTTLLREQSIAGNAAYVGDRPEDGCAADANQLTFYAAEWGYSSFPSNSTPVHWRRVARPCNLVTI